MGFTWIFGFVASFSGVQFFWYPFVVLNSLQGALVCLAFVCNRRVLGMWRARLGRSPGGQTSGSLSLSARQSQTMSSALPSEANAAGTNTLSKI